MAKVITTFETRTTKASRNVQNYQRTLKRTKSIASSVTASLAKLGAGMFGVQKAVSAVTSALDQFDRIGKMSKAMGQTAEEMQRLKIISEKSGGSFEKSISGIQRFKDTASRAMQGDKKAIEAFEKLNLDPAKVGLMSVTEILKAIEPTAKQAQAGMADSMSTMQIIFGRMSKELSVLLTEGADAMATVSDNQIVSDESVANIEELNDRITDFKTELMAIIAENLGENIGTWRENIQKVLDGVKATAQFISENGTLIKNIIVAVATWKALSWSIVKAQQAYNVALLLTQKLKRQRDNVRNQDGGFFGKGRIGKMGRAGKGAGAVGMMLASAGIGWEVGSWISKNVIGDERNEAMGDWVTKNIFGKDYNKQIEEASKPVFTSSNKAPSQKAKKGLNVQYMQEAQARMDAEKEASRKSYELWLKEREKKRKVLIQQLKDQAREKARIEAQQEREAEKRKSLLANLKEKASAINPQAMFRAVGTSVTSLTQIGGDKGHQPLLIQTNKAQLLELKKLNAQISKLKPTTPTMA